MTVSESTNGVDCPYPGLRPFRRDEDEFFFGREEHIEQLTAKLQSNRFVAVTGPSGCGKSSLVRAGLIPVLEHGFMVEAGANWRIAELRPGNAPFAELTRALLDNSVLGKERTQAGQDSEYLEATLRRGRLGLVDAVCESLLPESTNVLVLVDQFEEIFRYRTQQSSVDDADAFVQLLLSAAQHRTSSEGEPSIYVIITMRSDFYDDCALFTGLPEAINDSQFLAPRLTRDQRRGAIVGPARLMGGDLEPALVNRLLDELRTDSDQLPLLQHVLRQMWNQGVERVPNEPPRLTASDLEAMGGMHNALSNHADEVFAGLDNEQRRIAQIMFRCLSERSVDRHDTRRPAKLNEVAEVAGVPHDHLVAAVEVFRQPNCSFLTPSVDTPLTENTVLDISHESLIRLWTRLCRWVEAEDESAKAYRRLLETARLWKQKKANLWSTPELENAEKWRNDEKPNAAWAERYGGDFQLSMEFLNSGVDEREQKRRRHRTVLAAMFAAALLVAAGSFAVSVWARMGWNVAVIQEQFADNQRRSAVVQKEQAERSSYNARLPVIQQIWRNIPKDAFRSLDAIPERLREFTWGYLRSQNDPLLLTVQAHPIGVTCMAFSHDGKVLASAGEDGKVLLWHPQTLRSQRKDGDSITLRHQLNDMETHHDRWVWCVAFFSDGERLASAGEDGSVIVWNVKTGQAIHRFKGHAHRVRSLALSPDGKTLAFGCDDPDDPTIRLWNPQTGQLPQTLTGHTNWVSCVTYAPDGKTLASASYDTTIKLWDAETGGYLRTLTGHTEPVLFVAFSPDGKTLASASDDKTIRLWDPETGQQRRRPLKGHTDSVVCIAFSKDGKSLASAGDDNSIKLWDAKTWQERITLRRHVGAVTYVAFSPDGKNLASAGRDGTIRLWDAHVGLRMDTPAEHRVPEVTYITFIPESAKVATLSRDGTIRLWRVLETGVEELEPLQPHVGGITAVAFDAKGQTMATGHKNGAIGLWDVAKTVWKQRPGLFVGDIEHKSPVNAVVFSRGTHMLASGDEEGTIILWNLKAGDEPKTLTGHTDGVTSLAFDQRGKILASASKDQSVRLWDPETGTLCKTLTEHEDWVNCVQFATTGNTLASASDDWKVKLWKVNSLSDVEHVPSRDTLELHTAAVTFLAFSYDGKTLASAGMDDKIMLWDPELRQYRATLTGHTGGVRCLAFRHDGKMLASVGDDDTIRLWRAADPQRVSSTTNASP